MRSLPLASLVHLQRSTDEILHQVARIERRERVLKHHLAVATVEACRVTLQFVDTASIEVDAAGRRIGQTGDKSTQRGLPAAALADETQGRPAHQVEAHAIDGTHLARHPLHHPVSDREVFLDVANR